MKFSVFQVSRKGGRQLNEDRMGYSYTRASGILLLADGMGGHVAGEVASKVVIAALAPLDDDEPGDDLLGQLREATLAGNGAIAELVAGDPDLDGMGTTLSAILFAGNRLGLVHVGDSRVYLQRNGQFTQITHDDTFVQSLIDEGRITEDEAAVHPQRSLLLKALTGHEVEPTLTVREARPGDRYLLCSDGLSGPVSHETLGEAIQIPDPQECADRMIELALKSGGPDNVTVIIADVVDIDYGDNNPIVGGAAGNGSDERPPPDSPASRAGAITAPRPVPRPQAQPEPPDPKVRKRKRRRSLLLLLLVVLVLAAGAVGVRYWVNTQYFIGEGEGGEVAIFQGIQGSILGLSLHSQVQGSCGPEDPVPCDKLYVEDLNSIGQDVVRSGRNTADNQADAKDKLSQLRTQRLPLCEDPSEPSVPATPTEAPGGPPAPPAQTGGATTTVVGPTTTTAPTVTTTTGSTDPAPAGACRQPRDEDKGGG